MQIKAIIADDESHVRTRIKDLLSKYDNVEILSECSDGDSTVKALHDHKPQVLFLDIKMPLKSGFDVLPQVDIGNTLVVFITAHDEYAVRAFEYEVFDYILKPIGSVRFEKTMKRIFNRLRLPPQHDFLTVSVTGGVHKVAIHGISHVEAANNHVRIFSGTEIFTKRTTLRRTLDLLRPHGFVQIHRSFLININHIRDMMRIYKGDYLVKLSNGRIVPTSRSFRSVVKKLTTQ